VKKLALVLIVALTLAACGRKGDVRAPPGDEDSPYTRAYPSAIER
jgi:predicted small lipoprotein YifL